MYDCDSNIDDFHCKVLKKHNKLGKEGEYGFAFERDIIEVHGNVYYMRCFNACTDKFFHTPQHKPVNQDKDLEKTVVPLCKDCGGRMKIHTMMFDEAYSQKWYRSDEIETFLSKIDGLIVIGTTLETGLPSKIVRKTLMK